MRLLELQRSDAGRCRPALPDGFIFPLDCVIALERTVRDVLRHAVNEAVPQAAVAAATRATPGIVDTARVSISAACRYRAPLRRSSPA
jgi:hypothetical protein